jgi:hypothetical protein
MQELNYKFVKKVRSRSENGGCTRRADPEKLELASGINVNVQISTTCRPGRTLLPNITRNMGTDSVTGDPIVEVEVEVEVEVKTTPPSTNSFV